MKYLYTIILVLSIFLLNGQTTHQITASGLMYDPETITILAGDKIQFNVGASHPTVEVSEDTWNNNGSEALAGGFSAPNGNETIDFNEVGTFYYICTNHIGSGMKGKIVVEATTGIHNAINENLLNVQLYPNPVANIATLKFELTKPENVRISLYNLLGSKVKTFTKNSFPSGKFQLSYNFNDVPSGIYYLNIEVGTNLKTIKIIK